MQLEGAGLSCIRGSRQVFSNLSFQLRYRWEFAPLSNLFIAYVRGGSLFQESADGFTLFDEYGRAFDLRDSEQLLVKLSYRFTL